MLQLEYVPSLARDPELPGLVQAIKETYFSISRQGMGGMLGNMLQMLNSGSSPS
jgi:hypothetical protein